MGIPIDTTFHFEWDANGRDPDQHSPTLRRYHRLLWSKPLPDGTPFMLNTDVKGHYLHHVSARGTYSLSSDGIVHSYRNSYANRIGRVMALVPPDDAAQVHNEGSTIGGYMLFPGEVRDRKPTINGARGMHPRICDRFDLTLECIRRHYVGEQSPLTKPIERYEDFFNLFGTFDAYVFFFLLDDLVTSDRKEIAWFLPFDEFKRSPLPQTTEEFEVYRQAVLGFLRHRNDRIENWATDHLT